MNLYNIWVSLYEMSDKNIDLFHDILFFFLDVPVSKPDQRLTMHVVRYCKYKKKKKNAFWRVNDFMRFPTPLCWAKW